MRSRRSSWPPACVYPQRVELQVSLALIGVVVEAASRMRRAMVWVVPLPSAEATVMCVSSAIALTRAYVVGADDRETRSPTVSSLVKQVPPLPQLPEPTIAVVAFAVVVPETAVDVEIEFTEKSHELAEI